MNKSEILKLLEADAIEHEKVEHAPVFTIEDMKAAGLPHPEAIAKNLFVRDDKKRNYYLITVREEKRVDLKQFAQQYGTRKLSFAGEEDLMELLGLVRGAVTPFGLLNDAQHRVTFYLDRDFEGGIVGVHPNENTATVWLKTQDLLKLLQRYGCETRWAELLG